MKSDDLGAGPNKDSLESRVSRLAASIERFEALYRGYRETIAVMRINIAVAKAQIDAGTASEATIRQLDEAERFVETNTKLIIAAVAEADVMKLELTAAQLELRPPKKE